MFHIDTYVAVLPNRVEIVRHKPKNLGPMPENEKNTLFQKIQKFLSTPRSQFRQSS